MVYEYQAAIILEPENIFYCSVMEVWISSAMLGGRGLYLKKHMKWCLQEGVVPEPPCLMLLLWELFPMIQVITIKTFWMIPKTWVQVIGQRKHKNWKRIRMGESGERQQTVGKEGPWLQREWLLSAVSCRFWCIKKHDRGAQEGKGVLFWAKFRALWNPHKESKENVTWLHSPDSVSPKLWWLCVMMVFLQ